MSNATAALEAARTAWTTGNAFPAPPTSLQLALSSAEPLDDMSGFVEPTDPAYSRITIVLSAAGPANGVGDVMSNTTPHAFGTGTIDNGSMTHWAVFAVGGGLDGSAIYHGAITIPQPYNIGQTPVLRAGDLQITER
jgi:hypothetical protein